MNFAHVCLKMAAHQARNLRNVLAHQPLVHIPLGSMTLGLDDVEIARYWLANRHLWLQDGVVEEYESDFARWNGSRHAFSFLGGRLALSAAIYALDLKPGDEVVLPGYTYVVVPNAFRFAEIKTVYCDIDLETWGPEIESVEASLTTRTRAVLIQHLYGLVCRDYESILDLARRRGLWVIEDCAQATGAVYREVKLGNRADVAFYSSEQSKIFNTSQGGVAVTNDARLATRLAEFQRRAACCCNETTERLLFSLILNYYINKDPSRWWRIDLVNIRHGSKFLKTITLDEKKESSHQIMKPLCPRLWPPSAAINYAR